METGGNLVDTSPDLREQLLAAGSPDIDAVLLTHGHADHTHGLDDLRPLHWRRGAPLPLYTDRATLTVLRERFRYMFERVPESPPHFEPPLTAHEIAPGPLAAFAAPSRRCARIMAPAAKAWALFLRIVSRTRLMSPISPTAT